MKMLIKSVLAALGLVAMGCADSASAQSKMPFRNGEELKYTASYSASVLSTNVADVVLRVSNDAVEGIPAFKVHARGTTKPFYNVFFKLDDTYETWMERSTLRPLLATSNIQEGNYRYQSRISFNWKSNYAYTFGKNLKSGHEKSKTLSIKAKDFDPIAHFYNLRCMALGQMKAGETGRINLVMLDTIRSIQYKYLGTEIIETPNTGPVRCRKFTCQLAPGDAQSFKEGTDFLIWISDDDNKIPIYLETPIRVGKVFATLTSWKNLAHPFSSRIQQK